MLDVGPDVREIELMGNFRHFVFHNLNLAPESSRHSRQLSFIKGACVFPEREERIGKLNFNTHTKI